MIDINALRVDPEVAKASQRVRGEDAELVDALLAADTTRRRALVEAEAARAAANTTNKVLRDKAVLKEPSRRGEAIEANKVAGLEAKEAGVREVQAEAAYQELLGGFPNVVLPGVPAGGEDDFELVREVGEKPTFTQEVKDHVEIGTRLGILDLERGARTSGSRFYYLLGQGAKLERAIVNLALATAERHGLTEVVPPVLVKPEAMEGTGFLGRHRDEVYRLAADDLFLVGTSEVPLTALHAGEVLDGPKRYAASTTCFRREAGSAGRDTRGIFRVHQFQKVEMVSVVALEDALEEHQRMLAIEEEVLKALELPYRVINIAGGDLGTSAAQKFDCEAWVPSQERYREVTSTSNCTTFQARRLKTRIRTTGGVETAATLNGTLAAVPRLVVAILENHQQGDGTVRVPPALAAHLGRDVITA
jgi:seryl-tRNA synthetase